MIDSSRKARKGADAEERKRLFDKIETINRSWLDRMSELRAVEADFGAKLLSSASPQDAMNICNQWMAKRLEIFAGEQQTLAKSWVEIVGLLGESAQGAFAMSSKKSE